MGHYCTWAFEDGVAQLGGGLRSPLLLRLLLLSPEALFPTLMAIPWPMLLELRLLSHLPPE